MPKDLPITEFDILTLNESLHMFKAMIPFFDFSLQKPLSMIIRMQELSQTMQFYSNPRNRATLASQTPHRPFISSFNDIFSNEEFISTVLRYCPEKYSGAIEQVRSFTKMSDMMNMFRSLEEGADMFSNPAIMNLFNNMSFSPKDSENTPPPKSEKSPDNSSKNSSKDTDQKNKFQKPKDTMPDLFQTILTPKQQEQYNSYLKELADI